VSETRPSHCIAVIGGAVAGAEVTNRLVAMGCEVVVFEQNPRPYGKIEDGLPRWHRALRNKQYAVIRGELSKPRVHYVPLTQIGKDVDFRELAENWGFSAVILANGAWRDRPLPIDGADAYIGRGLVYQNPFITWFNHMNEPNYDGPALEAPDGAIVVGGGLAAIDVAKVLMLENTRAALRERGVEVDLIPLEVKGIPKTLKDFDLTFEDLGLEGCTIFYRRREEDMPLVAIPAGSTPEQETKVLNSRAKLLRKAADKYRFKVETRWLPEELLVEDDHLVGLRFRRGRVENGRIIATDETLDRRASCVISSIGSIPAPIEGIETKGELFRFSDRDLGRLKGFPTVFSAGNIVTGKGNIIASRKHAKHITEAMIESMLGLSDRNSTDQDNLADIVHEGHHQAASNIAETILTQPPIKDEALVKIHQQVAERQRAVGYEGNFDAWIKQVTPEGFE
jgi:NADPH-dependent glutamate synthase beta subunit-like oxidoreductase